MEGSAEIASKASPLFAGKRKVLPANIPPTKKRQYKN
jgi:hypothetical protein